MLAAVNWGAVAATGGSVATVMALVILPALVWIRRRGHGWLSDVVEEASEKVINDLVIPRLEKVEDSVHRLRGNLGEIAGRVSYLEGLEAGLLADRSASMPHARTRGQRARKAQDDGFFTLRGLIGFVGAALIALGIYTAVCWHSVMVGLGVYWTGSNPSPEYNWWSGAGSVIVPVVLQLLGLYLLYWWHTRCHVHECLGKGRHPHGPYQLCSKHHPDVPDRVTAAVVEAHRRVP